MDIDQKGLARLAVLALLACAAIVVYLPGFQLGGEEQAAGPAIDSGVCEEGKLCVIFFDVGQGDAIYIESPTGTQVLIDGGRGSAVLRQLSDELGFFDRSLDIVIATHPDADHIGGLVDVLDRYDVAAIVHTRNESDSSVADAFQSGVANEGASTTTARRGQQFDIGGAAVLTVLFPDRSVADAETNAASIVLELVYGESEFLFTGDAPKGIEEYLVLTDGEYLEADVLKVGHHGSRTSTSESFLETVRPEYAVISAGADNQYGHPHVEVTDILFNYGVTVFNTAETGDVVFISDGVDIVQK